MNAFSFQCTDVGQLEQTLSGGLPEGFRPKLAIVFSSIQHDLNKIRSVFSHHQIDMVGCSTAGEIVDQHLYEKAIAVLLLDLNRDFFRLELEEFAEQSVFQAAFRLGQAAKSHFTHPGLLVMSGGFGIDAEEIISGFQAALGNQALVFGGLAGDDLLLIKTFAFTHSHLTSQGVAALILDTEKVSIHGLAISGWEPIGGENVITRARGNVVYTINDEPAYDVFTRYFGLSRSESNTDALVALQTNYPFQFIREGGRTILRSPLLIDEKAGTIMLAANVREGDKFRFSYSPGFEIIDQTVGSFGSFHDQFPETDAVVLFSCKGRHGAFGPLLEKEISGIFEWWQKPMTGFLSYGEFGDLGNGVCEFHNETCALVLIKER